MELAKEAGVSVPDGYDYTIQWQDNSLFILANDELDIMRRSFVSWKKRSGLEDFPTITAPMPISVRTVSFFPIPSLGL